jgi:acetyltransferase
VDLLALERLLVRFSQLVVEQSWIKEIDINPLLASPEQLVALDARVVLHDPGTDISKLPRSAIRPYPTQYLYPWRAKDGTEILVRPIRPEDEPMLVKFHETLSDRSVYFRYFHMIKLSQRIAHERLTRMCFIDYDREMALVAECREEKCAEDRILGVGRLTKLHGTNEAEFAVVVSDSWQRQGIGTELLTRLIEFARNEKLSCIKADILLDNQEMVNLAKKLGFSITPAEDPSMVTASMDL